MKCCPQCGREYDLTMSFCLDDGSELLSGPSLPSSDEPRTEILSGERAFSAVQTRLGTSASSRRKFVRLALACVVVIGLLAAAVYTLKPFRSNSASRPVPMRFVIPAPEKASQILTPAVSPDGRMMIFSALFDGTAQLW